MYKNVIKFLTLCLICNALFADFELNNNLGYFRVDFQGNQTGMAPIGAPLRDSVIHTTANGTVKIAPNTSGYFSTSKITPSSFDAWTKVNITASTNNLNDLNVDLLDCTDTPIPGYQGLVPAAGQVDISALSATIYSCLRVRVNLSDSDGVVPVVDEIKVSWHGLPVFLLNISGADTKQVGDNLTYSVTYSLSYVDDTGDVIYVPVGNITDYNIPYGQSPLPSFVSASSGGQFTSTAITVNGISIPANSVYWDLGSLLAGSSSNLSFVIKSPNGQENNTKYNLLAYADSLNANQVISDNNPSLAGNQPFVTTLTSVPTPSIRMSASGGVPIGNDQIVYQGGTYTGNINYNVNISNHHGNGKNIETLFNPLVETDLTSIVNTLTASPTAGCGVSNFTSLLTVNDGGTYNPTTKKITWDLENNHLAPGAGRNLTFSIDYTQCLPSIVAAGTVVTANSTLTGRRIVANPADNVAPVSASVPVKFGLDTTPKGAYAKGERINGGSQIRAGTDDLPTISQAFGSSYSYLISAVNAGAVRLDKTLMFDRIPAGTKFSAASLPSAVGGTIYYSTDNTFTDPLIPPTYDVTSAPTDLDSGVNNFWERLDLNPPADLSTVRWVAFYVPCLSSPIFPSEIGSSCEAKPSSVNAEIQVNLIPFGQPGFTGTDICSPYEVNNHGVFATYAYANNIRNADTDVVYSGTPIMSANDPEASHIKTSLADLNLTLNGPSELDSQTSGSFALTVNNIGNDAALATAVRIGAPTVVVNGATQRLSFVSVTGGSVDYTNLPDYITVNVGNIAAGATKNINFNLSVPAGILDAETFTIPVQVGANDDNSCATISKTTTKAVTVNSRVSVLIKKTRDEAIVPSTGIINYAINFTNNGQSPTNNTYVIDKMPNRARFNKAYTSPAVDENGNTFNCNNCQVYFAKQQSGLPAAITPSSPLTPSIISTFFSLGVQTAAGVWEPNPSYCAPNEVVYVAYRVDDLSLGSPIFKVGQLGKVGLAVYNDENSYNPGDDGSVEGELIENVVAMIGGNLLQTIANQVVSVVLDDPGLSLNKTSSIEVVPAGQQFDWYIDYVNDSGADDTEVVITDILPYGTSLSGIFHSWNNKAATDLGTSTSEVNIASDPNVSIVPMSGGLTQIKLIIADSDNNPAPGLKGTNLKKQEGGRIRLRISTDSSIQSGTLLNNTVSGYYENPANSYTVTDEDSVLVQNPDLSITKLADVSNPVPGDVVNYTVNISNQGGLDAPDVVITDILPAGLCYVPNTVVLTSGYSIGEPTVTTAGCATSPTTLTWNSLYNDGLSGTIIPGNSGSIFITYKAQVDGSVPAATPLKNTIGITTSLIEDQIYSNDSDFEVRTPLPDAFLTKTSPVTGLPGESFDFTLTYGNTQRVQAEDVYIIDRLPDYDLDGTVDLRITNFTYANSESVYCHNGSLSSAVPAFNPANPLTGGWVSQANCLATAYKATHVAVVIGSLPAAAGPHEVKITSELVDPDTSVNVGAGLTFTNQAVIYSNLDDQMANNASQTSIKTPGADLLIEKVGSIEGASPGTLPGSGLTYTITGRNNGTQDVCAVKVKDLLPANVDPADVLDNFTALELLDQSGNPTFPNDALGNPVSTPVQVSRADSGGEYTWKIGGTDYSNICLPPGSNFSFEVNVVVKNSVLDGTQIENCANITEDSPAVEDILGNNNDCSNVMVYKADLKITKSGFACGQNNSCADGEGDNSSSSVNINELIKYKITYDNIGRYSATDSVITETVPAGTCYFVGSLQENAVLPGTIEYSLNYGATWSASYTPTPDSFGKDCAITNFRLKFASDLPAPATFFAQNTKTEFQSSQNVGTKAVDGPANTGQVVLGGNGDQSSWSLTSDYVEGSYSKIAANGDLNTIFMEQGNGLTATQLYPWSPGYTYEVKGRSLFFTDDTMTAGQPLEMLKMAPSLQTYTRWNSWSDYAYTSENHNVNFYNRDEYGNYYDNFDIDSTGKSHISFIKSDQTQQYDYISSPYRYSQNVVDDFNLLYWTEGQSTPRVVMNLASSYASHYDQAQWNACYSACAPTYATACVQNCQSLYNYSNYTNQKQLNSFVQKIDSAGVAHLVFTVYENSTGNHYRYWNSSMADNASVELTINGSPINAWNAGQLPSYIGTDGNFYINYIAYNSALGRYGVYSWNNSLPADGSTEVSAINGLNSGYSYASDDANHKAYITYSVYNGGYELYIFDSSTNTSRKISTPAMASYYTNSVYKLQIAPNGTASVIFSVYNGVNNIYQTYYWDTSMADETAFIIGDNPGSVDGYYYNDSRLVFDAASTPHVLLAEYSYAYVSGNYDYISYVNYWTPSMGTADYSANTIYTYALPPGYGPNINFGYDNFWNYSRPSNEVIRVDGSGNARILFSSQEFINYPSVGLQGDDKFLYYTQGTGLQEIVNAVDNQDTWSAGYQDRFQHEIDNAGISHIYFIDGYNYNPSSPGNFSPEIYYWNSTMAPSEAVRKTALSGNPEYSYEITVDKALDGSIYAAWAKQAYTSESRNAVLEKVGGDTTVISNLQLTEGDAQSVRVLAANSNQPRVTWIEYVSSNTVDGSNEQTDLFIYPSGDGGATGTVITPIVQAASGNLVGWGNLILNYSTPADSSITFDVLDNTDTPITGYTGLTGSLIDLSGISSSTYPQIKVRASLTASTVDSLTPILEKLVVTYFTDQSPYFEFKVRTKNTGFASFQILNNVSISTETPEVSDTNNSASHSINLINTNIKVDKTVDFSAARVSDTLNYTIHVCNDGGSYAPNVEIEDTYPAGLTITSHPCSDSGTFLSCYLGGMNAGECRDINISAEVPGSANNGDTYTNLACVKTNSLGILDTNSSDNCDTANTVVADLANVYVNKTGVASIGINQETTYTVNYGNSGNVDASDVQFSDPLDLTKVSFISAVDLNGNFICGLSGNTVICNADGTSGGAGITLVKGSAGTIEIKVRVNNDLGLVGSSSVIHNTASISTSTPQVDVGDDSDYHDISVVLQGLSSLAGKVYSDLNSNITFNAGSDTAIENVKVLLLGSDIFGDVWGPNPAEPGFTEFVNLVLPDLLASNAVPVGTNASNITSLPNYNVVNAITTDSSGNYSFVALKPGNYNVYQVTPNTHKAFGSDAGQAGVVTDDSNTAVDGHGLGSKENVTINASLVKGLLLGQAMTSIENNFALTTGSIGNLVFKDLNGNGVFDGAETGISNIEVTLFKDSNDNGVYDLTDVLVESKLTDASGHYQFNGLLLSDGDADADYIVKVTDSLGLVSDYVLTVGTTGADNNSQLAAGYKVSLSQSALTNNTADFGYYQRASLGDRVWFDENHDGIQNGSEVGIAGITVKLYTSGNVLTDTKVTDGTGNYLFNNIVPGDYYVEVVTGSYFIAPKQQGSATNFDSDLNANRRTDVLNLAANTDRTDLDFGLYLDSVIPSSVSGIVWYDNNQNGERETGDNGIPGVVVELRKADGTLVSTTTSDSNGNYIFSGLPADTYYAVFKDSVGYSRTVVDAAADNVDSDADVAGRTPNFTVLTGENKSGIDAGYFITDGAVLPSSIGDRVWFDSNQNGVQDGAETGISGIIARLYKLDGTLVASGTTDADGQYQFANLLPGNYHVVFLPTGSYQYTIRDFGGDDTLDSDANPLNGKTNNIVLGSGMTIDDVDAGFHLNGTLPGSIGDRVWFDLDKDGIDDGEPGLENVVVKLLNNIGDVVSTVTTNSSGLYQFSNVIPGTYTLEFTPPSALYQISPSLQGSDPERDSNLLLTGRTAAVVLTSGQSISDIDAAYYASGYIGNKVFVDVNANGILDAGEPGLANVGVRLYQDVNGSGTLDSSDVLISSTVTDVNGSYLFSGVSVDDGSGVFKYLVAINDTAGVTTKANPTNGAPGVDNNSQNHNGYGLTLSIANYSNFTADFGYNGAAKVGDTVWYDTDRDGIQDTNEQGVAGVIVELLKAGSSTVDATARTDGFGKYNFNVNVPGSYRLRFTSPYGYVNTSAYVGGDTNFDSNIDPTTTLALLSYTQNFEVKLGDKDLTLDGGILINGASPSSISDRVWSDLDGNGVFDATESGIPGITVHLLDANNNLIADVVSDQFGYYAFNGLAAGSYKVSVTLPAGLTLTTANVGDDNFDSDINPDFRSDLITLNNGVTNSSIDVGLKSAVPLAEIGDFVWLDTDADGIQDAGETGIPGILVELYNSTNVLVASTTTSVSGAYGFENLLPGDYSIQFKAQVPGYEFSVQGAGSSTDSDANSLGKTGIINLSSGESEQTIDAGLHLTTGTVGSIGSLVWNDTNANGVRESSENLLPGITVILYGNDGTAIATAVTGTDGSYLFSNLAPGQYYIGFMLPAGYLFTTPGASDSNSDSDAVIMSGRTIQINLGSGQTVVHIDAGIYQPLADCDGPANSDFQFRIDGDALKLAHNYKVSMLLRTQAKRACGTISKAKQKLIKSKIDQNYINIWTTVWTGLPVTRDSLNPSCSCSLQNISGTVNNLLIENSKLINNLNSILPESCVKKERNAKLKRKILDHKNKNKALFSDLRAAVKAIPQPMYDCN